MPLTNIDYRRTLDFLNYQYSQIQDIQRYLDEQARKNGEEWVAELKDLLDTLEEQSIALEREKATPQIKQIEIAGEQTVEYESSALLASYAGYNSNRAKLCQLTGLSIAPVGTTIIR